MDQAYRTSAITKMGGMTFQEIGRAKLFVVAACLVGLLSFSSCHNAPPLTAQEAEGKHFYEGRCAHCHRDNDLELKKVPPDLHGIFKRANLPSGSPATDASVRSIVLAGKGLMPAFNGRFDDAQMAALLAYLHTGLR
jgi:mono/diheme cytochrome c family protein